MIDSKYSGKRFAAFLVSMLALSIGVMWAPPESFSVFASTIGVLFAAYVAGQSTTDYKEAHLKLHQTERNQSNGEE